MAMIPCPECNVHISEDASDCPKCGYPVAEFAERGLKPGGQEPSSGLGGVFILALVLLVGYGFWKGANTSKTQAAQAVEQAAAHGEKLHWDLLGAVGADPIYRRGALVGAWTGEPRASICVPIDGWHSASESDQESLMRHAASLVPVMSADPFAYIEDEAIAEGEGATSLLKSTAQMQLGDWCIYVGTPVTADGTGGARLVRGDEVASGALPLRSR